MKKVVSSTTTRYVFSGTKVIAEYVNGSLSKEYIYSGNHLLSTHEGGALKYHQIDHLSVRLTTKADPNTPPEQIVLSERGHYPFGEVWYETSPSDKWKFSSYERDDESMLDYAIFRYYSSRLSRFMTPDPIAGSIANPQSLNRYAFVLNDPVNSIDPLGLCSFGRIESARWDCNRRYYVGGFVTYTWDGVYVPREVAWRMGATEAARFGPADTTRYDPKQGWLFYRCYADGSCGWMPLQYRIGEYSSWTVGYSIKSLNEHLEKMYEFAKILLAREFIDENTLTPQQKKALDTLRLAFKKFSFTVIATGDGRVYVIASSEFYNALQNDKRFSPSFNPGTHGPFYDSFRQNVPRNSLHISLLPVEATRRLFHLVVIDADVDRYHLSNPLAHFVCDVLSLCKE